MKKSCERYWRKIKLRQNQNLTFKQEERVIDRIIHCLTCADCMQKQWPSIDMIKSDAAVILTLRYNPDISLGFKQAFAEYKRRIKEKQGTGRDLGHLPGGCS